MAPLRDKPALVIPSDKSSSFLTTPANPSFPAQFIFKAEGKLSDQGVLDAKIEQSTRGDLEPLLRTAFRRLPQAQWKDLVQSISQFSGFAGTVSDVVVSPPGRSGVLF